MPKRKKLTRLSSCIKYMYNGSTCVGTLDMFITVCKCACISSYDQCDENCKTYAVVAKCLTRGAFFCDTAGECVPTISSCEKTEDFTVIRIEDILNVCYYVKVDENVFVVDLNSRNGSQ